LDAVVAHILEIFPTFGRRMIKGHLMYLGHRVSTHRVRRSYERVMGMPASMVRRPIGRRTYRVPGSNSLWHHDGQHSERTFSNDHVSIG
jgi:hypothetical protein